MSNNDLRPVLGFNLSEKFYRLVARKFDRDGTKRMTFDDFIQCVVIIQVSILNFDTSFIHHLIKIRMI